MSAVRNLYNLISCVTMALPYYSAWNRSLVDRYGTSRTSTSEMPSSGQRYASGEEFEKATKKCGLDFEGPTCMAKALDLGIAIGSAVKTASILNVDNRIMYRVGTAAKRLNYMSEASTIMGIPLSATGKNIYFDRP